MRDDFYAPPHAEVDSEAIQQRAKKYSITLDDLVLGIVDHALTNPPQGAYAATQTALGKQTLEGLAVTYAHYLLSLPEEGHMVSKEDVIAAARKMDTLLSSRYTGEAMRADLADLYLATEQAIPKAEAAAMDRKFRVAVNSLHYFRDAKHPPELTRI